MQKNKNIMAKSKKTCTAVKSGFISKAMGIPARLDRLICNNKKSLVFIIIWSFIFNYLFEASLRQSLLAPFRLLFSQPIVFILGTMIILSTFSIMYFFRRRTFIFGLTAFLWLIVLLVNFVLMCVYQRSTPFNFSDLRVFSTTKDIINNGYVNIVEILLIILGIILFLAFLSFLYIKCSKICSKANICAFVSIQICAFTLISTVLYTSIAVNADRFDNLPNKYREHGFAFCFLYSLIDNGIDKPKDYTPELYNDTRNQVNKVFEEKDTQNTDTNIEKVDNPVLTDNVFELVISDIKSMPDYSYLGISKSNDRKIRKTHIRKNLQRHRAD